MKRLHTGVILAICMAAVMLLSGCGANGTPAPQEKEVEAAAEIEETVAEELEKAEAAEGVEEIEEIELPTEEAPEQPWTEPAIEEPSALAVIPEFWGLRYTDDLTYPNREFPDLAQNGSMSQDEADLYAEYLGDLLSAEEALAAGGEVEFVYGDGSTQVVINDPEGSARVINTYIMDGNAHMDAIMNKVGYTNYEVDYYYAFGAFQQAGERYNEPVWVSMNIDGEHYTYCFSQAELVMREGPDGAFLNPETNEFMNGIYTLGCYYGNVLNTERDVYDLFITSMDAYTEEANRIVISCGVQGRNGTFDFVVDSDTVFSADAEFEFFSGYEQGESPLEWMSKGCRMLEDEPIEDGDMVMTALMGIFEVRASDGHVDELITAYWWD